MADPRQKMNQYKKQFFKAMFYWKRDKIELAKCLVLFAYELVNICEKRRFSSFFRLFMRVANGNGGHIGFLGRYFSGTFLSHLCTNFDEINCIWFVLLWYIILSSIFFWSFLVFFLQFFEIINLNVKKKKQNLSIQILISQKLNTSL